MTDAVNRFEAEMRNHALGLCYTEESVDQVFEKAGRDALKASEGDDSQPAVRRAFDAFFDHIERCLTDPTAASA